MAEIFSTAEDDLPPPPPRETAEERRDRLARERRIASELEVLRAIKRHGVYWPSGWPRRRGRFG